jgi:hypothetical protein
MTRTATFAREQLRAPFTLVLLIAVPTVFVAASAGVLSDFADALGGSLAGDAASALGAGWAAAFIAGNWGSSRRLPRAEPIGGSHWRERAPLAQDRIHSAP